MTYYFLSSSNLLYNFVGNSADCSLMVGITFPAGPLADLLRGKCQEKERLALRNRAKLVERSENRCLDPQDSR